MLLIDSILLTALVSALVIGGLRLPWRWLAAGDAGLAIAAWTARFILMVKIGDVAVAEDYLNGMTLLNAVTEIAAFWLAAIVCSSLGYVIARLMRRLANGN